eukprot:372209-Rhodomonas_salina.1
MRHVERRELFLKLYPGTRVVASFEREPRQPESQESRTLHAHALGYPGNNFLGIPRHTRQCRPGKAAGILTARESWYPGYPG